MVLPMNSMIPKRVRINNCPVFITRQMTDSHLISIGGLKSILFRFAGHKSRKCVFSQRLKHRVAGIDFPLFNSSRHRLLVVFRLRTMHHRLICTFVSDPNGHCAELRPRPVTGTMEVYHSIKILLLYRR